MTRFWFWPAVAALAISLGVAAAPVVWHVLGEHEGVPQPMTAIAATVPETGPSPHADLAMILAAAPFGQAVSADVPAVETVPAEGLGLALLGVTFSGETGASRAIIAGGDTPVASYASGMAITAGVALAQIRADHVILTVNGATATLYFADQAGNAATNTAVLVPMATSGPLDPSNPDAVIAFYRNEILQNPQAVLDRLGLQATPDGYLIAASADPDILRAGFQTGDLVTRVNGLAVGDVAQDQISFDAIAASGQATVEIERAGQIITMTFPLR